MADIVLAPLLQAIFEKLASPIVQKFAEYWELEDRIKKRKEVLSLVQAILEDAEEQQAVDKAVKIWVSKLKDATYRAEDLLEEFVHKSKLTSYAVNVTNIRNVLDTLQKAAIEGLKLNLKERKVGDRLSKRRETGSLVMSSEVFGRGEERRKIVEQLLTPSISEGGNTPVISIVGVPGIGKTTLAQLVYNDEDVKKHFDVRIWVFVSDEFIAKNIIRAAIESTTARKCELSELDALQSQLWNILHRKRFLFVLDDVWSDDQEDWDMMRPIFSAGIDGSKILITSRQAKVAFMMDTPNMIHSVKRLTEEDTWALFKRYALNNVKECDCQNLLSIGKEISKNCAGIPLAAKIIGSMMRFKREEKEWLHVKNSSIWNLGCFRKQIAPVLLLSFLHLPSNIKHCFSFCATFPKNYEIEKENLINMWIAHGLVFGDEEGKQLEDIAEEYFDELSWMSFFVKVNESCDGVLTTYKMHDLFYSFARHLTTNETTILASRNISNDLKNIRHASIVSDYRSSMIPKALCQAKYLRTLLVFSVGKINEVPSNLFSNFIHLRVLDLSGCSINLPQSIGELRFLKYLDLSNTEFQELPSSISSLHSLMTLNLFGCHNLQMLPALGHITSLRHLIIDGCEALTQMPHQIERLVHLQTLSIFIVRFPRGLVSPRGNHSVLKKKRSWKSSISDLQFLNLRGQLKIKHLEYVSNAEEAEAAKLKNKEHLESLGLCWGSDGEDLIMNPSLTGLKQRKVHIPGSSQDPQIGATLCDQILAAEVLAYLQPHQNLENLFIAGYPGIRFPHWMLPRVTKVVLINCRGCLHLPSLGHLPSLRILHVEGMHTVTRIGQEFYGDNSVISFPSLHELSLKDFPLLEEWSTVDGREMFLKLRKLTLGKCPNLISVPLIPTLQDLKLQGCNPAILGCIEELTLISTLVIEEFGELLALPGKLLGMNHLLKYLKISSCPNLQCLPPELGSLTSLESLILRWCWELFSLPKGFQNLTSLESLEISDCHSLAALSEGEIGGLISLRTLSIENCSKLSSIKFGLQHLTALEHLTIMYCPSLSTLPDGMGHLFSLKSLTILSSPRIEFLPEELKYLKTLQCLEIRSCQRLAALPQWFENLSSLKSLALSDCPNVRSLPVAFRNLSALQHLSIQDCPHLQIRCEQDGGVDWWKVAHVPYKHIFSSPHRSNEDASSSSY